MAHRAPLIIADYSDDWPRQFAAERNRLLAALPTGFDVEHVGSTAVPDLAAKPIIDLMLGAASLSDIEQVLPLLQGLGYDYRPEHEVALPERRFLAWPMTRPRQFHLHAVEIGSPFWHDHLRFRDRLRADPELAQHYAQLKRALAKRHGDDRAAYTEVKSGFIRDVLAG